MREILFRGKAACGAWVQGDLIHRRIWQSEFEVIRVDDSGFDNYQEYEVATETVGQYTGFTDKNGKKIFEGDIVKNEYRKGQYQYFKIVYDTRVYCWQVENKYGMLGFLYNVIGDLEVIGNIHDNPELLEVK